jgi:hypothetical protein
MISSWEQNQQLEVSYLPKKSFIKKATEYKKLLLFKNINF